MISSNLSALRYTNTEGQWKDSAVRLTNALVNVRAIINHFTPKVESWAASNGLSSLEELQVWMNICDHFKIVTMSQRKCAALFRHETF